MKKKPDENRWEIWGQKFEVWREVWGLKRKNVRMSEDRGLRSDEGNQMRSDEEFEVKRKESKTIVQILNS